MDEAFRSTSLNRAVLRQIFEASPNPYMVLDREFRYVAANRAYLSATGARCEDLLGRNVFDLYPHDEQDELNESARILRASFERVLAEKRADTLAFIPYRVPKHGEPVEEAEVRYWSATNIPLLNEAGEVSFILQHTVDVTELHALQQSSRRVSVIPEPNARQSHMEAGVLHRARSVQDENLTLEAERKHLRRLLEQAPGFTCFLRGKDHVFELPNSAYLRLVGHRDIEGKPLREALPEVVHQGFVQLLDEVLRSGEPYVGRGVRVELQRAAGGPLVETYLDFVYQPIVEPNGAVSGVFVQGHDITEQRRAQQELARYREHLEELVHERTQELERSEQERSETEARLRQAMKMEAVGNLTGGVAHDFNNILQVIAGNLRMLEGELPQTASANQRLQTTLRAVQRGRKLSQQLLAFARRQPLAPRVVSPERALGGIDELLRRTMGEHIELAIETDPNVWNTFVDPNQLDNVLLNLAINARDAMGDSGLLTLQADNVHVDVAQEQVRSGDLAAGEYVRISLSDTGCGMPPEVAEHAFEPFFTTKPEGHGTGLGLSMVYGFAKQSGGYASIRSVEGQGTTVELLLPRTLAQEEPEAETAPQLMEGGSETVLVAEDDREVRATAVDMLRQLGYRVLEAGDANAALSTLVREHVDLLFTDVVMPGPLRSSELAERATQLQPGIAVLFTSGYTRDDITQEGRLDPGVSLLSKPYEQVELALKVRASLRARSIHAVSSSSPVHVAPMVSERNRVLLVEDDEDVLELSKLQLERHGYLVEPARSATEAEHSLNHHKFDALVTDLVLPDTSGLELARNCAERFSRMGIVLATGYSDLELEPELAHAVVLTKPFEEKDIVSAVTRAQTQAST
ncbi:MAG: response regulator [Myxococcales bacterium]